jgi:purine-nucleoside phosphorylase
VPTPHIAAPDGAFAPTVLLPGDPLRARWIAETFLTGAEEVTSVRNMLGYTGSYEGRPVSVMGTGMGVPSISIYATELARVYGVRNLVRVGSCGAVAGDVALRDVIVALGACTDSGVNRQRFAGFDFAAVADFGLTRAVVEAAERLGVAPRVGSVLTSDLFYDAPEGFYGRAADLGVLAVEMEAAGLYGVAAASGARALALLTVSDHIVRHEALSVEDRQTSFAEMVRLVLEASVVFPTT